MLFFTGLLIRGLALPTLQGWDWDNEEFEDISAARSALETITSMDIVDQPLEREAFEGTRTEKVLHVPLAGPVLYTERMVDPTLYSPSYYKKSVFGVSLLPTAYRPKNRGKRDILTRRKRIAPIVVLLICWGTVTATAGGAISGGVIADKYQADIEMIEKPHEKEVRELESLFAEATAEPMYYDRDYVDEAYIDPESLWAPVVDRAGDGYPTKFPEGHWMNYANKEMNKKEFTS